MYVEYAAIMRTGIGVYQKMKSVSSKTWTLQIDWHSTNAEIYGCRRPSSLINK